MRTVGFVNVIDSRGRDLSDDRSVKKVAVKEFCTWRNRVLVCTIFFRCNIPTYTIFHYPTCSNVNTYPIPVCPLGCAAKALWCSVQPTDIHRCILYLCIPLMCAGNGSVSECYTGSLFESRTFHWKYSYFSPTHFFHVTKVIVYLLKNPGFFHNKEIRSFCASATVLASEKEIS